MSEINDLTFAEAADILEILNVQPGSVKQWGKRSDKERLAIGLIFLNAHMSGASQRKIAAQFDVSQPTVGRYIKRALETIALPTVTEARMQAIAKIDAQLEVWEPLSLAGDEKAAGVVARFYAERFKITGVYTPIEISASVTEISAEERELQEMLAEQERDNKVRAAELETLDERS